MFACFLGCKRKQTRTVVKTETYPSNIQLVAAGVAQDVDLLLHLRGQGTLADLHSSDHLVPRRHERFSEHLSDGQLLWLGQLNELQQGESVFARQLRQAR